MLVCVRTEVRHVFVTVTRAHICATQPTLRPAPLFRPSPLVQSATCWMLRKMHRLPRSLVWPVNRAQYTCILFFLFCLLNVPPALLGATLVDVFSLAPSQVKWAGFTSLVLQSIQLGCCQYHKGRTAVEAFVRRDSFRATHTHSYAVPLVVRRVQEVSVALICVAATAVTRVIRCQGSCNCFFSPSVAPSVCTPSTPPSFTPGWFSP